jgi:hypothetical protein
MSDHGELAWSDKVEEESTKQSESFNEDDGTWPWLSMEALIN